MSLWNACIGYKYSLMYEGRGRQAYSNPIRRIPLSQDFRPADHVLVATGYAPGIASLTEDYSTMASTSDYPMDDAGPYHQERDDGGQGPSNVNQAPGVTGYQQHPGNVQYPPEAFRHQYPYVSGATDAQAGYAPTTTAPTVSSLGLPLHIFNENLCKPAPYKLPRLDDDNFREWSQTMRRFLRGRKLWGIVDGSIPCPGNLYQTEVWMMYADFVAGILINNATTTQKSYISSIEDVTPKEIFDTWSKIHLLRSKGRLMPLLTKMLTMKATKDDSVDKIASSIKRANEQVCLINNEAILNDIVLGLAIMNAFREIRKFSLAIYRIENDEETFSSERVIQRLKTIEQNTAERVTTQNARVSKEELTKPRRQVTCYNCQKQGHIARDCKEESSKMSGDDDGNTKKDKSKPAKRNDKKAPTKRGSKEKGAVAEIAEDPESEPESDESAYLAIDESECDDAESVYTDIEVDDNHYEGIKLSELLTLFDIDFSDVINAYEYANIIGFIDIQDAFEYADFTVDLGDGDDEVFITPTDSDENSDIITIDDSSDDQNTKPLGKKSDLSQETDLSLSDFEENSADECALIARKGNSPSDTGLSTVSKDEEMPWTIDSGATRHMCVCRTAFRNFKAKKTRVMVGGKGSLDSPGRGDVIVEMNGKNRLIQNVLWVPDLGFNLLSISALEDKGMEITFGSRNVKITQNNKVIAVGKRYKNLYLLARIHHNTALLTDEEPLEKTTPMDPPEEIRNESGHDGAESIPGHKKSDDELFRTLHNRLGHPSIARLCAMTKTAFGIPKLSAPKDFYCDVCENNKLTRRIRKYRYEKETEPGSRLFCDVWGPYTVRTPIPGITPYRYFLSVVDEATGSSFLLPLQSRATVVNVMVNVVNTLDRKEGGITIRYIRCDNAKEFIALEPSMRQRGITMEYTTFYTPEQNGVAERFNRTIITMVRCMLHQAGLPDGFWLVAAIYANWLRQRLPLAEGASPYERWFGTKPLISNERTFGMLCKVSIPKERRKTKLDEVAMDAIYLGTTSHTQHSVYIPSKRCVETATVTKVFDNRTAFHLLTDLINTSPEIPVLEPMTLSDPAAIHYQGEYVSDGIEYIDDNEPVQVVNQQHDQNIEVLGDEEKDTPMDPELPMVSDKVSKWIEQNVRESSPKPDKSVEETSPQRENSGEQIGDTQNVENKTPVKNVDINRAPGSPSEGVDVSGDMFNVVSNRHQASNTPSANDIVEDVIMHDAPTVPIDDTDKLDNHDNEEEPETGRSLRQRHDYNPYSFDVHFGGTVLIATANADPINYQQAIKSPDSFRWLEAIQTELNNLSSNNTWEAVEIPTDRKLITSKWVFKKKYLPSGLIDKYKARLVARGFTQQQGIDFEETFSPTLRYESLRLLFATAAVYGLQLWLLDVVSAYLNGDIDKEIFMRMPEGLPVTDQNKGKCLRLLKGLYGLKQSGRIWAEKFRECLCAFGFVAIQADQCIFIRHFGQEVCLVALYVDDIIIATKSNKAYGKVKEYLTSVFKITDGGPLKTILGIRVSQNDDTIAMDQTHYVNNLLDKYGMTNCNGVSTPIDGYDGIQPARSEEERSNQQEYQQLVGELMFLQVASRPDLAFAISKLSQFCNDPTIRHRNTLFRVLKYLKFTPNLGLCFQRNGGQPKYFADAAFADNRDDRRSSYGFVMTNAGGACVWYSRKQRTVATSTVEAEYMSLAEGCKASIWANRWMNESGLHQSTGPIILNGDNNGSISLSKNPENHARTKHIEVQYHFIREKVLEGLVDVKHVSTKDQLADIMTKPLTKQPFESNRLKLGLHPIG